jgi:MraZ protein
LKEVRELKGLLGEYRHVIDAKGRLFIPSRLLRSLGDTFYISKSEDPCLNIYALEEWGKMGEKEFTGSSGAEARSKKRNFYSVAQEGEPDSQGRVLLSQKLRDYAGLKKNVVIVGAGEYAEIWDADRWDAL